MVECAPVIRRMFWRARTGRTRYKRPRHKRPRRGALSASSDCKLAPSGGNWGHSIGDRSDSARSARMDTSHFIEASPGIRLNFVDWGQGKPLVLLHGWPFDLQSFEYQLMALPEQGIRCLAYDRRGFGRSTKAWQGYDYDTLSDDLAAF